MQAVPGDSCLDWILRVDLARPSRRAICPEPLHNRDSNRTSRVPGNAEAFRINEIMKRIVGRYRRWIAAGAVLIQWVWLLRRRSEEIDGVYEPGDEHIGVEVSTLGTTWRLPV